MRTTDFIQLLELAPNKPIKVEYLPGMFVQSNFGLITIDSVKDGATQKIIHQIHLNDAKSGQSEMKTTDLFKAFGQSTDLENLSDEEVRVVYGNKDFKKTALDICEVEVFQGNFTLKLFSTNNLKKAKERNPEVTKDDLKKSPKKRFSSLLKKLFSPIPLGLSWETAKLQLLKSK
ncbi:hypothetical protein GCM10028791_10510 [Echinicola sediminis]